MILVDDKGEARLCRLIESLQIRIVHPVNEAQNYFYEFTLDRQELFSGKSGLRAVKSDQVAIPLFNQTHDKDLFESPVQVRKLRESAAQRARQEPITENLRSICVSCHKRPEMGSTTTFFHDQSPELTAAERVNEVERILNWKRGQIPMGTASRIDRGPKAEMIDHCRGQRGSHGGFLRRLKRVRGHGLGLPSAIGGLDHRLVIADHILSFLPVSVLLPLSIHLPSAAHRHQGHQQEQFAER
jgi:hypothetical protein